MSLRSLSAAAELKGFYCRGGAWELCGAYTRLLTGITAASDFTTT